MCLDFLEKGLACYKMYLQAIEESLKYPLWSFLCIRVLPQLKTQFSQQLSSFHSFDTLIFFNCPATSTPALCHYIEIFLSILWAGALQLWKAKNPNFPDEHLPLDSFTVLQCFHNVRRNSDDSLPQLKAKSSPQIFPFLLCNLLLLLNI